MIERSITPDLEKTLAELAPITPAGNWWYIPKAYREAKIHMSECPQFLLRELRSDELLAAPPMLEIDGDPMAMQRFGLFIGYCVRRGLVGWKNWKANGKEVEFKDSWRKRGELDDKAIGMISPALLMELSTAITAGARLKPEETEGL